MAKSTGTVNKITIQLEPKMEVTSSDIFRYIFYRNRKSVTGSANEKNHGLVALEIFKMAASKPEHLPDNQYESVAAELNVTVSEYQHIVKKMRMLGMIKKSHGKYYAIRDFAKYLRRMGMAMQNFCDDQGIPLENE